MPARPRKTASAQRGPASRPVRPSSPLSGRRVPAPPPALAPPSEADPAKLNAARAALSHVRDGMRLGLGSGSTSALFIRLLGERARSEGWTLACVATSQASEDLARACGLRVESLDALASRSEPPPTPRRTASPLLGLSALGAPAPAPPAPPFIDLAVDGADQVDAQRRLIKGYGGALTREKVVEYSARRFIVIADEGKRSRQLDKVVPVEFLPFARAGVERGLAALGCRSAALREEPSGAPYTTDNGLHILHAEFGPISDPARLEREIKRIPGVLESGLFTCPVERVYFGTATGVEL